MNELLTKKTFKELATVHDQHCVSIYVPTQRSGNNKKGKLYLKNVLKEVKTDLYDYGLNDHEIEEYLHIASGLLDDTHFWSDLSDCLVIFIKDHKTNYFTLPIRFPSFKYVSDHFYLLPMLKLFNNDGRFYLLNLSLQNVKLYEGSQYFLTEIKIDESVPVNLEEVVGSDFKDKSIQFRTGQGGEAGVIYHGQGVGKDDKQIELEKFMRAVDYGIRKLLADDNAPLILACVDYYYPVFKKITAYSNLLDQHISGNHEYTDAFELHEMAWELVRDIFKQEMKAKIQDFSSSSMTNKTSFDLNDIIPAAIDGRIDVLFVCQNEDRYGQYDKVNRTLIIDEHLSFGEASLFNIAAVNTWLNGGKVYVLKPDEMPVKETKLNAMFRF